MRKGFFSAYSPETFLNQRNIWATVAQHDFRGETRMRSNIFLQSLWGKKRKRREWKFCVTSFITILTTCWHSFICSRKNEKKTRKKINKGRHLEKTILKSKLWIVKSHENCLKFWSEWHEDFYEKETEFCAWFMANCNLFTCVRSLIELFTI